MAYDCVFLAIFLDNKIRLFLCWLLLCGPLLSACSSYYFSFASTTASRLCLVTQKVTVTKRSPLPYSLYLCIYLYLFLLPCLQRALHPTLLWPASPSIPLTSYSTVTAFCCKLALPPPPTANGHVEGNRWEVIWAICIVGMGWYMGKHLYIMGKKNTHNKLNSWWITTIGIIMCPSALRETDLYSNFAWTK